MTNLPYLAEGVEASRLRSIEILNDLSTQQHEAEQRQKALAATADYSPPFIVCHLGADKWVAIVTAPGQWTSAFTEGFSIKHQKDIYSVQVLTPFVLSFRCRRKAEWIREEISLGFLPF